MREVKRGEVRSETRVIVLRGLLFCMCLLLGSAIVKTVNTRPSDESPSFEGPHQDGQTELVRRRQHFPFQRATWIVE